MRTTPHKPSASSFDTYSVEAVRRHISAVQSQIESAMSRLQQAVERADAERDRVHAAVERELARERRRAEALAWEKDLAATPEQRERHASRREVVADERERLADARERLADERERRADARERLADEREQKIFPAVDPQVRASLKLRVEAADNSENLAETAESIAAGWERAAERGDSDRRMRFAAAEREIASVLRENARKLRGLEPGPLQLQPLPSLPESSEGTPS